jgi:hypothetical protein
MSFDAESIGSSSEAGLHWDLDRIVAELRTSRAGSRQNRGNIGSEMPSREALVIILDGLFAALFPTRRSTRSRALSPSLKSPRWSFTLGTAQLIWRSGKRSRLYWERRG